MKAKQKYYHGKIEENIKNPRKIWSIMSDIAPTALKAKTRSENSIPAEEFAQFFAGVTNPEDPQHGIPVPEEIEYDIDGYDLTTCTEDEVLKVVNGIPTNKADGIDGIPIKAIKLGLPQILKPLTSLINSFIVNGFPDELKRSIVLPIHKKGPTDKPDNYRPISILPCISKITERVIANQLSKHINENALISKYQHGFRQQHSTCTGLLQITEFTRRELDLGRAVGVVALDLSKAFDSIDHQILIRKLPYFNLGYSSISFLKKYLSERTFIVKSNNEISRIYKTTTGVPQGSILGPLLFTLYINDLPQVIKHSQVMLYADDTTLFTGDRNPHIIQTSLNQDIENLQVV